MISVGRVQAYRGKGKTAESGIRLPKTDSLGRDENIGATVTLVYVTLRVRIGLTDRGSRVACSRKVLRY